MLALKDGFRVEGPACGKSLDYRLMRYARNEMQLARGPTTRAPATTPRSSPSPTLLGDPSPAAVAQLHWRIAPPLLALAFVLLAVPLSRSSPRQARYGSMLLAFLAYLVGIFMMVLGTQWLADGTLPPAAGLWWLLLPMLALGGWLYLRDGRMCASVVAPMNLRPKLHDHYIARIVIVSVLGTWGVLLGLDVVLAFAGEFGNIGKGSYTIDHAIAAIGAVPIPWRAYTLFPTAAVIGSLLGLGQLAGTSELTALRALGLSRRRLSASVAFSLAAADPVDGRQRRDAGALGR